MALLRLAPEIQEWILAMPKVVGRPAINERALRPTGKIDDTREQVDGFRKLVSSCNP